MLYFVHNIIRISFIMLPFFVFSQKIITGEIINEETKKEIPFASIQLIEKETGLTKDYTMSQDNGAFSLKLHNLNTEYVIKVSILGYDIKTIPLSKSKLNYTIFLKEKTEELKEIVINAKSYKDFQIKKDTISYNLSKVRDSTEVNLKNLVEKLSGLTIDSNKKINFQGKIIDRVTIDGEDFFGKKHEMATENLPAEAVEGIQILKNFKDFDDIGNKKTGKIVLNITLNKDYKNKISGNITGNSGVSKKYQAHANIFKFFEKGNFALVSESNNIGEEAINISDYMEMQGGIKNFTDNYKEGVSGVYQIDITKIPRYVLVNKNVDSRNTIFNSLNFVNKLSNKTKINGYLTFDYTKITELKKNSKNFVGTVPITLQEKESNVLKSYLGNSFVNIIYKKDKNQVFKYNLKISPFKNDENLNIIGVTNFNNTVYDNDFSVGQGVTYKNQLNNNLFLQSNISYDYKDKKRDVVLNGNYPFLDLLFLNNYIFQQKTTTKQNLININSKLIYNLSKQTKLASSILFMNNYEKLINKAENQSSLNFNIFRTENVFSLSNSLTHKFNKNFFIKGGLNYIHNTLNVSDKKKKHNWILPHLALNFEFDDEKTLNILYSEENRNILIFQMNTVDKIVNYQTRIKKNETIFTPINQKNYGFNYNNFNASKNRMFSVQVNYFTIKNQIGYNTHFTNNFIKQEYVRIPEKGFNVNLYYTKTMRFLPLKWNAKFSYKNTNLYTYFNHNKNKRKGNDYVMDIYFTSMFKKLPFQMKLNFNAQNIIIKNDFKNLDYSLIKRKIHPKFYGKFNEVLWELGCLYQSITSLNSKQNVYSLNFSTQWNFSKRIELFCKGNNVLNLKNNQFMTQQITESFSKLSVFEQLEGNILIGMRYHF